MFRKNRPAFISLFLILALFFVSIHISPAKAQDDDFPVTIQLTGVIQSVSSTQLVFTNGTVVTINPGTKDIAPGLQAGMTVTVVAEMDNEQFVAKSIKVADGTSATSTTPSDDGKDKGKGNSDNANDDNKGGKGKGKDGKGQGNSSNANNNADDNNKGGKGKGKDGKGQGNSNNSNNADDNNKGGKGKGRDEADKDKAACLARTDHPVATQLANSLNVSYAEIMKLHCDGTGFGEIARAYVIAKNSKLTVQQIFAMRKDHKGWGQIIKAAGLKGKAIGGLGKLMGNKAQKNDK